MTVPISLEATPIRGLGFRTIDGELARIGAPAGNFAHGAAIPNRATIVARCEAVRKSRKDPVPKECLPLRLLTSAVDAISLLQSRAGTSERGDRDLAQRALHAIGWVFGQGEDESRLTAQDCCDALGITVRAFRHRFTAHCRQTLTASSWDILRGYSE